MSLFLDGASEKRLITCCTAELGADYHCVSRDAID